MSGAPSALAFPLDVDGVERLRRALPQMLAIGGDVAWVGAQLDAWLAARPDERLNRRDAAIEALASFCEPGSTRRIADQVLAKLRRYETTRWRRERELTAAPLAHGAEGAALFALMRASGATGSPGDRTIRSALAAARVGQKLTVSVAHETSHPSSVTKSKRNRKMNVATKPAEFEALAALARQPATIKLLEDDRAKTIAERRARVDRIKALDAKSEIEWPQGQRAIAAAALKVREAERRLREANDELAAANAAASNASHSHTTARQGEEAALIAGADIATIDAWKRELLAEFDAMQRPGAIVYGESVDRHPVTRKEIRRGFSNVASVRARMAAVRAALEAADLLKLEPDQRRLPAIIAEALASLPKVDQNPSFAEPTAA